MRSMNHIGQVSVIDFSPLNVEIQRERGCSTHFNLLLKKFSYFSPDKERNNKTNVTHTNRYYVSILQTKKQPQIFQFGKRIAPLHSLSPNTLCATMSAFGVTNPFQILL